MELKRVLGTIALVFLMLIVAFPVALVSVTNDWMDAAAIEAGGSLLVSCGVIVVDFARRRK